MDIKLYIKRVKNMNHSIMFDRIKEIHKRSGKPSLFILIDMIYCSFKYKAASMDYYIFFFERLNREQRASYVTWGINRGYLNTLNNMEDDVFDKFDNKARFNKIFSKYIKRDFIDLSEATYKEYTEFVKKHRTVIAKPLDELGGHGVEKVEIKNMKKCYEKFIENKQTLLEEVVVQHKKMNELNPSSVNTMRVITARNNGKTHVIVTALRIGNGGVVDNFSSGGMVTIVGPDGKICKPAFDEKTNIYEYHPVTKTKIVGFKVPYYKTAIKTCLKMSEVIEDVGLVGWDVAITEKGVDVIEGNNLPGYSMYQSDVLLGEDKMGYKPMFDSIVYGGENE